MSFSTAEATRRLVSSLRTVLKLRKVRLTKFFSNNPTARTALPKEDKEVIQRTQRKSLVKLGVFRMARSQLQR